MEVREKGGFSRQNLLVGGEIWLGTKGEDRGNGYRFADRQRPIIYLMFSERKEQKEGNGNKGERMKASFVGEMARTDSWQGCFVVSMAFVVLTKCQQRTETAEEE